jgi:small-conductance mechanosensitive channel
MQARTPSRKRSWILGLGLILGILFPLLIGAEEKNASSAPSPAETKTAMEKNGRPTETDEARALTERYRERLGEIKDEQDTLQSRLEEAEKELKSEEDRLVPFLQIEDITAEEFNPTLNKWKVMLSSYKDVLEDVNNELDEVNQIRIRIESKLRLWELREGDLKLQLATLPKEKQVELKTQIANMQQVVQSYEEEHDKAQDLLTQLGKNKTNLSKLATVCEKNYGLLSQRWEEIRFTRLKFRQQPKFSLETFHLALQELDYRLRDTPTYRRAVMDYAETVFSAAGHKFIRTFLWLMSLFTVWLVFFQIRRGLKKERPATEKATLLEKFGRSIVSILISNLWGLFLLAILGTTLLAFPETREGIGLFIFFALSGAYGTWLVTRIFRALFESRNAEARLLSLPPKTAQGIYRTLTALTWTLYVFILLGLMSTFLDFESEGSRFVKWLLEIIIFGLIFSLTRRRWISELAPTARLKLLNLFRKGVRLGTFLVLVLIIGLDGMGYTYLSDYLADASLKTLVLIPFLLFLRKGLLELIDYKLVLKGFSRFKVSPDLLIKWKKTLRQWTALGTWAAFFFGFVTIWDIKPEAIRLIKKILSWGFGVGSINVTLALVISVFLAFYVSILFSRLIRALLERNLYPRRSWDLGIRNAISTGVHYLLVLIGLLVAMHFLGFDLKNITVLAGALGVGLGFGLQNLANNFASGIVLLVERPIKVGDTIKIGELTGKVKKIGARSTAMETIDQATILIPNGELLSGQVTNWTYNNPMAGLSLPVGVAYGSDTEKVKAILLKIAEDHPDVQKDPKPEVEFKGFGDSSLNFVLRIWINDVEDRRNVQTELYFAMEKALRENKIDIPFPHREIIMKNQT